jgi:hypothetical protein
MRLNIGVGTQAIGRIAFSVTGDNVVPIHLVPAPPSAPVVTQQPADATASATTDATFTGYAVGEPAPLVHWQSAAPGADWADVPNATANTLTVSHPAATADGTQYRAVFVNLAGTTTSDPATLHVQ